MENFLSNINFMRALNVAETVIETRKSSEAWRMKEFMTLENLALITQIVSFPVAALAIVLAKMDARRAHDLDVVLNLSATFRDRWEQEWRSCLNQVQLFQQETVSSSIPDELEDQVLNILNWIDWVGSFLIEGLLAKENVLLQTLGPQLSRAIDLTSEKIKADIAAEGPGYWAGVVAVTQRLRPETLATAG
jgi:hypothetical protein